MTVKQIAIYLLKRFSSLTNREIGDIFKMNYHTVRKAVLNIARLMEERPGLKQKLR
ncbi:MAG: hypothetical protein NC925_03640 [Candidatus Omnitrophica bacterium]|nr:hypothetical protein [Candidatus Omnitrophota bacterium]